MLAHELAHHAHGDMWRGLGLEAVSSLILWPLAAALLAALPEAVAHGGAGDPAALPAFALAFGVLALPFGLLSAWQSRQRERARRRVRLPARRRRVVRPRDGAAGGHEPGELMPPWLTRVRAPTRRRASGSPRPARAAAAAPVARGRPTASSASPRTVRGKDSSMVSRNPASMAVTAPRKLAASFRRLRVAGAAPARCGGTRARQPEGRRREDHVDHQPRRGAAGAGLRVLVVDLDPQSNLTMSLGIDPETSSESMFDVLVHRMPIEEIIQRRRARRRRLVDRPGRRGAGAVVA